MELLKKFNNLNRENLTLFAILTSIFNVVFAEGKTARMVTSIADLSLSKVVVTASGCSQEIKDDPASISIISGEMINNTPFKGIGSVLQDIEGVSNEQSGKAGGTNISLRGLPNDYTLLLIDGKRLSQNNSGARPNGFGDVDTNFIPLSSAIGRIEVVRGPMSALYASRTYASDVYEKMYGKGQYTGRKSSFFGLGQKKNYTIGTKFTLTPNNQNDIVLDLNTGVQRFDNKNNQLGTRNDKLANGVPGGGYAD